MICFHEEEKHARSVHKHKSSNSNSSNSDMDALPHILKLLEIRDERLSVLETEIKRLFDNYSKLREELLPLFRLVKESKVSCDALFSLFFLSCFPPTLSKDLKNLTLNSSFFESTAPSYARRRPPKLSELPFSSSVFALTSSLCIKQLSGTFADCVSAPTKL